MKTNNYENLKPIAKALIEAFEGRGVQVTRMVLKTIDGGKIRWFTVHYVYEDAVAFKWLVGAPKRKSCDLDVKEFGDHYQS